MGEDEDQFRFTHRLDKVERIVEGSGQWLVADDVVPNDEKIRTGRVPAGPNPK